MKSKDDKQDREIVSLLTVRIMWMIIDIEVLYFLFERKKKWTFLSIFARAVMYIQQQIYHKLHFGRISFYSSKSVAFV